MAGLAARPGGRIHPVSKRLEGLRFVRLGKGDDAPDRAPQIFAFFLVDAIKDVQIGGVDPPCEQRGVIERDPLRIYRTDGFELRGYLPDQGDAGTRIDGIAGSDARWLAIRM